MLYVVDRLNNNVLNYIKSNITKEYTMFDHENWQVIVIVIKQIYNETNFVKLNVVNLLFSINVIKISKSFETNFIVSLNKLKCRTIKFWIIWKIVYSMKLKIDW